MANNYNDILALVNAGNQMGLSNTIKRDYGIPLDFSSVYATYEEAAEYASTSTKAYEGQIIAAEGVAYIIIAGGLLKEIGTAPVGDNKTIVVNEQGIIAIKGIADAAAGSLPRATADGSIEWVPVSSVVEGDTNTITLINGTDKTGATSSYDENTTTYTYTINADVTLEQGENSVTIKQNGIEIGTISLTATEVAALQTKVGELESAIATAQGDATKGINDAAAAKAIADANTAEITAIKSTHATDKATLEAAIQANTNAITLLTDNPDTEAIDSVKELVDYVAEHGTDVTQMQTDIAANADAIAAEKTRAETAEETLAGRAAKIEAALGDSIGEGKDFATVSAYVTSAITDLNIDQYATDNDVAAVDAKADENATAIGTINDTTIPAAIQTAKEYADEKIAAIPTVELPVYAVAKTSNDTDKTDTYTVTKTAGGSTTNIAESIVVPRAYDDTALAARIAADEQALANYKTEVTTALEGKAGTNVTNDLRTDVDKNASDIASLSSTVTGANGISTRLGAVETKATQNAADIQTNTGSITTINTEISSIKTAAAELTTEVGKKADAETVAATYQTKTAAAEEHATLTTAIAEAKQAGDDAAAAVTALTNGAVADNAAAIATLIGATEGDDAKSARTIAAEEAEAAVNAVVDGAPEAFDTLKEIAAWIQDDTSGAAALTTTVGSHSDMLAGIGGEGQPATVLAAIEAAEYDLPAATLEALGGIKASESIAVAADGTATVAQVSTDVLVQGTEELILNGGSATV